MAAEYHEISGAERIDSNDDNQSDLSYWTSVLDFNLTTLMDAAGYDQRSREQALDFCSKHVAPFLDPPVTGRQPRQWRSFMTDDFTPLELSWAWDPSPKSRFSFEPVGDASGELSDPLNWQAPPDCAQDLHTNLPCSEWTLFKFFVGSFCDPRSECKPRQSAELLSPFSIFLALDEHLQMIGRSAAFEFAAIAIDCVAPSLSRLKVYFRKSETSFQSVCDTLTMYGKNQDWTPAILANLQELWYLVLGLDEGYALDAQLPPSNDETGGMLYNMDVQTNNTIPDTKVYIPVKHYGKNDRDVLSGLVCFLDRRGWTSETTKFTAAVERLCHYRDLQTGRGFQTYISCAVKKGELSLTSYFSPELYYPGRWT